MILNIYGRHHPVWDANLNKPDKRGQIISDLIDDYNIVILNTGVATRWEDINTQATAIDLTITTPNLAPHINWDISEEDLGSDHKLIICKIHDFNKFPTNTTKTLINKDKAINNINEIDQKVKKNSNRVRQRNRDSNQ